MQAKDHSRREAALARADLPIGAPCTEVFVKPRQVLSQWIRRVAIHAILDQLHPRVLSHPRVGKRLPKLFVTQCAV